jgi:hydroxymethylpyrimidine pyrophosphatase-like HAD family hydrolase
MGHAAPEVRRVARAVTASNDEDGVAHALRGWVLRRAET